MVGRVKFGVSAIGAITVASAGITLPLVEGPSASAAAVGTWTVTLATNQLVAQSAPVLATVNAVPSIVVGDNAGKITSFNLSTGAQTQLDAGGDVEAPLAWDQTNNLVYVPHDSAGGANTVSTFQTGSGFAAGPWSATPCNGSTSGAACHTLSGAAINGNTIVTGGDTQYISGATINGAQAWSFLSTDSTNSTPAVADLYGTGKPVSIFADDQTPNSLVTPPAQSGGHLRIMTQDGQQICNYNVTGGANPPGSFNSSPAVSMMNGSPMIAVGSGTSGAYANKVLFFDDACHLLGTSPQLSGPTTAAPAIVDLAENNHPYAVVETAPDTSTPATVYAIDMAPGAHQFQVSYQIQLPSPAVLTGGSSVVAADLQGWKGGTGSTATANTQSIVAPTLGGVQVVDMLQPQASALLNTFSPSTAVQNTPVLDAEAGHIGVTVAGYTGANNGSGEVDHWQIPVRTTPNIGWGEFHHDPALSGTAGTSTTRDAVAATTGGGSDGRLTAGQSRTSLNGQYTATMQADGNLVITGPSGVLWNSQTNQAGSYLSVGATSAAIVNGSGGVVSTLWSGPHAGPLVLQMQNDGHLGLSAADSTDAGHEQWGNDLTFWRSGLPTPTITFNPSLSGYRTGTQSVTATSNGTAPVVISSESPSVCWVDTSTSPTTARFLAAGNCVLDANEVADTSYNAAAQVQRTIVISPSPPTAPTAVAPTSGSAKLAAGKPYTFTGKLTTNGVPLANGRVMMMIRNVGTTAWALKKTVSSDASGVVSFTFTPVRNTQMMWQFAATNAYGASNSGAAVREVDVQPRISIAETKSTIAKGTLTRFWGAMTPGFTGELITLQQLVKGTWVTLKVAVRVKLQKLPNGKTAYGYVMPYKGTTKGRFAYRVMIHRDNNFLAAVSPLIYLRIT